MSRKLSKSSLSRNSLEEIRTILDTDPSLEYKRFEKGHTLLHRAVLDGRVELVDWLATNFAHLLDTANNRGDRPLHIIGETFWLERGKDGKLAAQLAEVLLSHGASLDTVNNLKETPLLSLFPRANCEEGWLSTIGILLSAGADPNAQDGDGNTYLHKLAMESDEWCPIPLIQMLLDGGADSHLKNLKGETPIELANNTSNRCHTDHPANFIKVLESQNP